MSSKDIEESDSSEESERQERFLEFLKSSRVNLFRYLEQYSHPVDEEAQEGGGGDDGDDNNKPILYSIEVRVASAADFRDKLRQRDYEYSAYFPYQNVSPAEPFVLVEANWFRNEDNQAGFFGLDQVQEACKVLEKTRPQRWTLEFLSDPGDAIMNALSSAFWRVSRLVIKADYQTTPSLPAFQFMQESLHLKEVHFNSWHALRLARPFLNAHPTLETILVWVDAPHGVDWQVHVPTLQAMATIPRLQMVRLQFKSRPSSPLVDGFAPVLQQQNVKTFELSCYAGTDVLNEADCRSFGNALGRSQLVNLKLDNITLEAPAAFWDGLRQADTVTDLSIVPPECAEPVVAYLNSTSNLKNLVLGARSCAQFLPLFAILRGLLLNDSLQSLNLNAGDVFLDGPGGVMGQPRGHIMTDLEGLQLQLHSRFGIDTLASPTLGAALLEVMKIHPNLKSLKVGGSYNRNSTMSKPLWDLMRSNEPAIHTLHWSMGLGWQDPVERSEEWRNVMRHNTKLQDLEYDTYQPEESDDEDYQYDSQTDSDDDEETRRERELNREEYYQNVARERQAHQAERDETMAEVSRNDEEAQAWVKLNREHGELRHKFEMDPLNGVTKADTVTLLASVSDNLNCTFRILSMVRSVFFGGNKGASQPQNQCSQKTVKRQGDTDSCEKGALALEKRARLVE